MYMVHRTDIRPFIGKDGALIRELAAPANAPITSHSLAEIRHPPGTASQEHYHTVAEEVWDTIGELCSPNMHLA
jgi:hypothetical protein